jgi:tetratricopeptide (TPR) repeat protein
MSMTSSSKLVQMQQMFYLGKLREVIHTAQIDDSSFSNLPVQLLVIRSLMEQGRFRRAEDLCKTLLETDTLEEDAIYEIRLWQVFLQIYVTGDPTLTITEGKILLEWVRLHSENSRLAAQIRVMFGKALALTATWGLVASSALQEGRVYLTEALESYQQIGASREVFSTHLALSNLYLMQPDVQRTQARFLLQQAYAQALSYGNQTQLAEVTLRLAELDFDLAQSQTTTEEALSNTLASYQKALDLYVQAGHALGPADVWLSLGRRLTSLGANGLEALQQAFSLYRQEENLTGMQSVLSALGTWYVQQGDLEQSLECQQQGEAVSQEMGFPIGQATAYLGLGDHYFRHGDYAKALTYLEQAEKLNTTPAVSALLGLSLANMYTLMHLPERAIRACANAINVLTPAGPSERLSLARYILGNVLSSKGEWSVAIQTWKSGLGEDEARHDVISQAQKLQCIAQATVMQYYHPNGPLVSEAVYAEAIALFTQSLSVLQERKDPQSSAVVANTYQLQGLTAATCGRPIEALQYLEQAQTLYVKIGLAMQAANTSTMVGLIYYDWSNRNRQNLYADAIHAYEEALDYFLKARMLDTTWKLRFHIALSCFHQGRLAMTAEAQHAFWLQAIQQLDEAENTIEFVRGHFVEVDQIAAQNARIALVADKEKIYVTAIQLQYHYLHNAKNAFTWLERLKGRSFLDALALTSLRSPVLTNIQLLIDEKSLLLALENATTQTEVVDVNEQLHMLWNQMMLDTTATEYVILRRGGPMSFDETLALLRSNEDTDVSI